MRGLPFLDLYLAAIEMVKLIVLNRVGVPRGLEYSRKKGSEAEAYERLILRLIGHHREPVPVFLIPLSSRWQRGRRFRLPMAPEKGRRPTAHNHIHHYSCLSATKGKS